MVKNTLVKVGIEFGSHYDATPISGVGVFVWGLQVDYDATPDSYLPKVPLTTLPLRPFDDASWNSPSLSATTFALPSWNNYAIGSIYHRTNPYTSAELDSIAMNDVQVVQSSVLMDNYYPNYVGLVDDLQSRNPDIIVLSYVPLFGIHPSWEWASINTPERAPNAQMWLLAERMGGWGKEPGGDIALSEGTYRIFNFGSADNDSFPEAMAITIVNALAASTNSEAGLFIDWFNSVKFPDWASPSGSNANIDFDQNGTPHSTDTLEQAAYVTGATRFLSELRRQLTIQLGEDRVVLLNGTGPEDVPGYREQVDGIMFEKVNSYSLLTKERWEHAAWSADHLYKGNFTNGLNILDAIGT